MFSLSVLDEYSVQKTHQGHLIFFGGGVENSLNGDALWDIQSCSDEEGKNLSLSFEDQGTGLENVISKYKT